MISAIGKSTSGLQRLIYWLLKAFLIENDDFRSGCRNFRQWSLSPELLE